MMNPGWQQPDDLHPLDHTLTRDPDVGLTDYIVKNKYVVPPVPHQLLLLKVLL